MAKKYTLGVTHSIAFKQAVVMPVGKTYKLNVEHTISFHGTDTVSASTPPVWEQLSPDVWRLSVVGGWVYLVHCRMAGVRSMVGTFVPR